MIIKYRLSKNELYDMIIHNLCETRSKRLEYILREILASLILVALVFLILENGTFIPNIVKIIIVIGVILIAVLNIISVVKFKGLILNHTVKYIYESELNNMCDTDIKIKLTENKIIINKNDNELISPVSDVIIKVRNDKFIQIKVDFQYIYIPCSAFHNIEDRETFMKIIQSI